MLSTLYSTDVGLQVDLLLLGDWCIVLLAKLQAGVAFKVRLWVQVLQKSPKPINS